MWIVFNPPAASDEVWRVRHAVVEAVEKSRFVISRGNIEVLAPGTNRIGGARRWTIKVSNIRLRVAKDYCGQHPGPCQVIPGFKRPHARRRCLEGADFIGWNDGLNDICDRLGIVADIHSGNREALVSRFYIRRGRSRRVHYGAERLLSHGRTIAVWAAGTVDDFADYCGALVAPRSTYPPGTPGFACWTLSDAQQLQAELSRRG